MSAWPSGLYALVLQTPPTFLLDQSRVHASALGPAVSLRSSILLQLGSFQALLYNPFKTTFQGRRPRPPSSTIFHRSSTLLPEPVPILSQDISTMPPKRPAKAASEAPNKRPKTQCGFEGCQKTFQYPSHMDRHVKNVHQKIMHRCSHENCQKEYPSQGSLDHHIQNVHKGVRFTCSCKYQCLSFHSFPRLTQTSSGLRQNFHYKQRGFKTPQECPPEYQVRMFVL